MKIDIRTIFMILLTIINMNIVSAQQGRPQGPPPIPNDDKIEVMVADLAKELSLTDQQNEQVSDLYFEHFETIKQQQKKNKGSRGTDREAMMKLDEELQNAIKGLLDEKQKELYDAYLKKQKANRGSQEKSQG
jgi:hypothetical protein